MVQFPCTSRPCSVACFCREVRANNVCTHAFRIWLSSTSMFVLCHFIGLLLDWPCRKILSLQMGLLWGHALFVPSVTPLICVLTMFQNVFACPSYPCSLVYAGMSVHCRICRIVCSSSIDLLLICLLVCLDETNNKPIITNNKPTITPTNNSSTNTGGTEKTHTHTHTHTRTRFERRERRQKGEDM